jgi:RNA polymerase sigma-70 factor, ECF subfamily
MKKSTNNKKPSKTIETLTGEKPKERLDQTAERGLLRRLANGDRVVFDEVHQRFAGLIFATVYQVLRDHQDTEDVSQEVFLSLWKKAGLYQENKGEPLTWVSSLARNRAIDRLRSKERRARLRDAVQADPDRVTPAEIKDASEQTSTKERGNIVRSAVMELTSEQRQVIELAYFSGLSQSQIADQLDAPLGTIKARMRRGLGKLRGLVEDQIVPLSVLMAVMRLSS